MKISNPYESNLIIFFEVINHFKHSTNRLNKVLLKDVDLYNSEHAIYHSSTSLNICDWTGTNDNGWKKIFPTKIIKVTDKENYPLEIQKLLSREFGFAFAQCYEAFETLIKELITIKINTDEIFKNSLPTNKDYSRNSLKGGDFIFKLINKACGKKFIYFSHNNNMNFKFKEMFNILSQIRHAITHSQGNLNASKLPMNEDYYKNLFKYLMPLNNFDTELIILKFDHKILNDLLIHLAEFGYQIFKIISKEDNYDWKI